MIHNVRVIGRRSSRAVSCSASVAARVDKPSAERLIIEPPPLTAEIGGLAIGHVSFLGPNHLAATDPGVMSHEPAVRLPLVEAGRETETFFSCLEDEGSCAF